MSFIFTSQSPLVRMNIDDAEYLFISSGSTSPQSAIAAGEPIKSAQSSTDSKLFKITDEGVIQEVTYEDENGQNIKMTQPQKS